MKETSIKVKPEDAYEKAIREIEEKIATVVKNNPGISTKEVYERERLRMRTLRMQVTESIKQAFTGSISKPNIETI